MAISAQHLEKLNQLIITCGQQAKQMAAEPFQVFEKGIEDYVTTVDQTLDRQLSAGIAALFTEDGIISEENPESRGAFLKNYPRLWLIDPLDGTEDFIQQRPHYSVMVGLLEDAQPIEGWVYAPVLNRLYFGGASGLFQINPAIATLPQPLVPQEAAPPSSDFCPMIIGDRDVKQYGDAILHLIPEAQFISLGSFGLKVVDVICGRAGVYVYFNRRVKLWDTVGPLALAKAAGLVCCDLNGNPLEFTADAVDPETLIHKQPMIIGWEHYVEKLRSRLKTAVEDL